MRLRDVPLIEVVMDRYMRSRQFADAIGVKEQTLRSWRVRRSDGPIYVKIGGLVLYPISDNQRWIDSRKRRSTSQAA